jgi:uncharacterized protein (DUF433 family)
MRKVQKLSKVCEVCGRAFQVYPTHVNPARFCSTACMGQWQQGQVRPGILPRQEIIDRYLAGETLARIATHYGVSLQAIRYHLVQENIPRRWSRGALDQSPETREKTRMVNRARKGEQNHNFIDLPLDKIVQEYGNGATCEELAAIYGVATPTIARKLDGIGIARRPRGFSVWRTCPDGHRVQSRWEQQVDEWLDVHHIAHLTNVPTPGNKRYRSDFLAGSIYIEVWGINGDAAYERRKVQKVTTFAELGIQLVQILPQHILANDYSALEAAFHVSPSRR